MEETKDSILNLMIGHHALIETTFEFFREEMKKSPAGAGKLFKELKWEMEKHFFAEESAIFDLLPEADLKVTDTIKLLKHEHIAMMGMLVGFEKNLSEVTEHQIEVFYNLLESHRKIEEKDLYPKLDEKLSSGHKKEIEDRISEIPIRP